MFTYELRRDEDATGVSGVGVVAQGVVFDDGTVAQRWLTANRSTALYASIADVIKIHGHEGRTRVVLLGDMHRLIMGTAHDGSPLVVAVSHTAHDGYGAELIAHGEVHAEAQSLRLLEVMDLVSEWLHEHGAYDVRVLGDDGRFISQEVT